MKEFKIDIPEGYEIDEENSTFECIKFKKKEEVYSYNDIAEKLFNDKEIWYIDGNGGIGTYYPIPNAYLLPNNCCSKQQCKKLLAINKLINVATYLNDGWKPDWNNHAEHKYYIYYDNSHKNFRISTNEFVQGQYTYFKSEKLANQAIEILGEETIKIALS